MGKHARSNPRKVMYILLAVAAAVALLALAYVAGEHAVHVTVAVTQHCPALRLPAPHRAPVVPAPHHGVTLPELERLHHLHVIHEQHLRILHLLHVLHVLHMQHLAAVN